MHNDRIQATYLLAENIIVSGGTSTFNSLDLNNIDLLSVSGVDITITSGAVNLTNPVSAPNLVYNTGNQYITGAKIINDEITIGSSISLKKPKLGFYNGGNGPIYISGYITDPNGPEEAKYLVINDLNNSKETFIDATNRTISGKNLSPINFATNINAYEKLSINAYTSNGYDSSNNDFRLNIGGVTGSGDGILIDSYGAAGSSNIIGRKARGLPTNLSGLQKEDLIFSLQARGYSSGQGYTTTGRASWRISAEENWTGNTNHGTYMTFRTTNTGTASSIDKLIINTSGVTALNGNLYSDGNITLTNKSIANNQGDTNLINWYGFQNTTGIFEIFPNNDGATRLTMPSNSIANLNLSTVAGYVPSVRMSTFNSYYNLRRGTSTITFLSSGLLHSGVSSTNPLDIDFGLGGVYLSGNSVGQLSILTRPNTGVGASAGNTRVKCFGQFNIISMN